jgi:proteasome lid subunit RPN8/RPN11
MKQLLISNALWFEMINQAEENLPNECCGFVVGKGTNADVIIPVENVVHSPTEFQMDANRQIREMLRIEKEGKELLAIYHSHPDGPDFPSTRDVKQFMYPESYSIILSRKNQIWSGRGFQINGDQAEEILILIE